MPKNILAIGVDIPGEQTTYTNMKSKLSLLDYDISIFNPALYEFYGYSCDDYLGKRCLPDSDSFQLREHIEHWRREILESIKAGKTVFIILNEKVELYVATGEKTYSGTGRNRQTTRHVALTDNYQLIPGVIEFLNSNGTSMKLSANNNILASYWAAMGVESEFKVLVSGTGVKPLITTKTGEKAVGAIIRYKNSNGALVLLPFVNFNREKFTYEKEDEIYWTDEAVKFGKRFISGIVGVDKVLRQEGELTPVPNWVSQNQYILPKEQKIREKLLTLETKLESLQKKSINKNLPMR